MGGDRKYLSTNDDGTNVDLWGEVGDRQKWKITKVDEYYTIQVAGGVEGDRKYLSTNDDGTNVDLWGEVGDRQKWKITVTTTAPDLSGTYTVVQVETSRFMDAYTKSG